MEIMLFPQTDFYFSRAVRRVRLLKLRKFIIRGVYRMPAISLFCWMVNATFLILSMRRQDGRAATTRQSKLSRELPTMLDGKRARWRVERRAQKILRVHLLRRRLHPRQRRPRSVLRLLLRELQPRQRQLRLRQVYA